MSSDQEQEQTVSTEEQLFITKKKPVLYAFSIFIFLIGILIIILGAVLPELQTSSIIVFCTLGSLLTLSGLVAIFGVPLIAGNDGNENQENQSNL